MMQETPQLIVALVGQNDCMHLEHFVTNVLLICVMMKSRCGDGFVLVVLHEADCHQAFAHASDLYGRKIVCDDTHNVHIFENGVCSCRDTWR